MEEPGAGAAAQEAAIAARRALMASGTPEEATAAAYELGVFFAQEPARRAEAVACFRRVLDIGLPVAVPGALLTLAGVLFHLGDPDAAEEHYRRAGAAGDPAVAAAASYGLGVVLATRPGRTSDALAAFADAAGSGDPEYVPLAAYDAGVLLRDLGRVDEAVASWGRAARTGPPDVASRAAFNAGVTLALDGRVAQAEEWYREAVAAGDADIAPTAAVNLGVLLEQEPGRSAAAEAAYAVAIAADHPDQTPMALANWGSTLAAGARREEAVRLLGAAVRSGHPDHAPRAAHSLGLALRDDPARRDVVESMFGYAAEHAAEPLASQAAYNLGRFLAEDPGRRRDAVAWLGRAAAGADAEVRALAGPLVAALVPERLVPDLDGWRVDAVTDVDVLHLEEYLRAGERVETWQEIVTITRRELADDVALAAVAEALRSGIASVLVDGTLGWTVLSDDGTELVYESTVTGDATALDQTELVRLVRRGGFVHTVQHAIREPGVAEDRAARLAFLATATLRADPPPSPPEPPPEHADLTELVDGLIGGTPPPGAPERVPLLRRAVDGVAHRRDPMRLATLRLLLGLELAGLDRLDALDGAVTAYRRALAVIRPATNAGLRGKALSLLAAAWTRRASLAGTAARDRAHAVACLRAAEELAAPGSADRAAAALDRADVELVTDRARGVATLRQVVRELENQPLDTDPDVGAAVAELVGRATDRLVALEREAAGALTIRRRDGDPADGEKGTAVYLRPLLTNATLLLPNRFDGRSRVAFEHEPDVLTVEATIYRSVGWRWNLMSVGEIQEGFGGTRITIARGGTTWQESVSAVLELAHLVILVPSRGEGVAWEMAHLRDTGMLPHTVVVMPPAAADLDVPGLWAGGAELARSLGLRLPAHDPAGCFLVLDADGAVADSWPFPEVWDDRLAERTVAVARRVAGAPDP